MAQFRCPHELNVIRSCPARTSTRKPAISSRFELTSGLLILPKATAKTIEALNKAEFAGWALILRSKPRVGGKGLSRWAR